VTRSLSTYVSHFAGLFFFFFVVSPCCCVDFADSDESRQVVGCLTVRREWFQTNKHVYFGAYFWCRVVLVHLVPCSALIVLNALLVREMRRAQRRRAHLLAINMRRNECRRLADSNVTTLMLVVVVGLFLLVEFPLAVLFILLIVKNTFQLQVLDNSAEKTASLVVNMCILFSYPINFFVYCGMSRTFRQTFTQLFCPSTARLQVGQQSIALEDFQAGASATATTANRVRCRFSYSRTPL